MARKGPEPGDVVRYDPAPEPLFAAFAIFVLMLIELAFAFLFLWQMGAFMGLSEIPGLDWMNPGANRNGVAQQKAMAFWFGSALLTLAAILSIYRRFFLPDVMIVKRRKRKYEDLM